MKRPALSIVALTALALAGCSKPTRFGEAAANVRDKLASDAAEAAFIQNLGPDPHQDSWRPNRKLTPMEARALAEEKARAAEASGLPGQTPPSFGPSDTDAKSGSDATDSSASAPRPPPAIYYYPTPQPSEPPPQ